MSRDKMNNPIKRHSRMRLKIRHSRMRLKIIALAGLIGTGILGTVGEHLSRETYRARVTGKERVIKENESKYLVFTQLENGEPRVFENTDSGLELKFNSSDVYTKLEVGKTYDIRAYGFRVPFLSTYENIVDVEPAEKNNGVEINGKN